MSGMKSKSRGDGSAMAFDDGYKNFKETSALMDRIIADMRRLLEIRYENDERTWQQFERVLLATMSKRSTDAALAAEVRCPACFGRGFMAVMPGAHLSVKVEDTTCPRCKGEGTLAALTPLPAGGLHEPRGTYACPICGSDKPHYHDSADAPLIEKLGGALAVARHAHIVPTGEGFAAAHERASQFDVALGAYFLWRERTGRLTRAERETGKVKIPDRLIKSQGRDDAPAQRSPMKRRE